jgi:rod shape-determining protein MreD
VRRAALALVSLAVLLLQVGLLPALRPFGVVPNLALVWIVLIGLEGSASLALIYAVVIGVSLDVASGASFGLWTGMLVLAALAAGVVHRAGIELTGSLVAAVMVAVGTVLTTVVILGGAGGRRGSPGRHRADRVAGGGCDGGGRYGADHGRDTGRAGEFDNALAVGSDTGAARHAASAKLNLDRWSQTPGQMAGGGNRPACADRVGDGKKIDIWISGELVGRRLVAG